MRVSHGVTFSPCLENKGWLDPLQAHGVRRDVPPFHRYEIARSDPHRLEP